MQPEKLRPDPAVSPLVGLLVEGTCPDGVAASSCHIGCLRSHPEVLAEDADPRFGGPLENASQELSPGRPRVRSLELKLVDPLGRIAEQREPGVGGKRSQDRVDEVRAIADEILYLVHDDVAVLPDVEAGVGYFVDDGKGVPDTPVVAFRLPFARLLV